MPDDRADEELPAFSRDAGQGIPDVAGGHPGIDEHGEYGKQGDEPQGDDGFADGFADKVFPQPVAGDDADGAAYQQDDP